MKLLPRLVLLSTLPLLASTISTAQNSWVNQSNSISPGNLNNRAVPSSVYIGTTTYVAYGSTNYVANDSYKDAYLYLADNGGSGLTLSNSRTISYTNTNGSTTQIAATFQPALAYDSYHAVLYLAYTSGSGALFITSSPDRGSTWAVPTALSSQAGTSQFSPSLTVDTLGQHIYVGIGQTTVSASTTNQFVLCTLFPGTTQGPSCVAANDGRGMNYGPSVALVNGYVYAAYADRGDAHCLYFYRYQVSSNGPLQFYNPLSCSETTSAAPSLLLYGNNGLVVGYRANNSDKFIYRISSDGGGTFANPVTPGPSINGAPNLTLFVPTPGAGTHLGAVYTYNGALYSALQQ